MKSKWFKIYEKSHTFSSKKRAENLKDAWDKTLKKWKLIIRGYDVEGDVRACGLCNLYKKYGCTECPIYEITDVEYCADTPYDDWDDNPCIKDALLEYLFLLIVREATK